MKARKFEVKSDSENRKIDGQSGNFEVLKLDSENPKLDGQKLLNNKSDQKTETDGLGIVHIKRDHHEEFNVRIVNGRLEMYYTDEQS